MLSFRYIATGGLLLVLTAMPAYAYLDPVTGTFLIQGIIAGVAACLAGIRSLRQRIVGFFSSIVSRKK
ncbi:hypothetical protein [Dongia sp.]|uniref:hypothetical protein n=1 Tax=Dongia sp. TaxID=1977262 RepID=UPI0035B1AEBF